MTDTKLATARPWQVVGSTGEGLLVQSVSDSSNRAWDVAEIYGNANAALICQAVNSFDAMREALQAIISGACEHGLFAGESVDPEWYLAQAKAALKLAEGR